MPNPFTYGPVSSPGYFRADLGGRGRLAHDLLQELTRADRTPGSVSIIGDRRSGKTSLLEYLRGACADRGLITAQIDLLSLDEYTPQAFYRLLTQELQEQAPSRRTRPRSSGARSGISSSP